MTNVRREYAKNDWIDVVNLMETVHVGVEPDHFGEIEGFLQGTSHGRSHVAIWGFLKMRGTQVTMGSSNGLTTWMIWAAP